MFRDCFGPASREVRGSLRMFVFLWVVVLVFGAAGIVGARAHSWYPLTPADHPPCFWAPGVQG